LRTVQARVKRCGGLGCGQLVRDCPQRKTPRWKGGRPV